MDLSSVTKKNPLTEIDKGANLTNKIELCYSRLIQFIFFSS